MTTCKRDCRQCPAWEMCYRRDTYRPPVRWYAGFLRDGRQVTPAYPKDEVGERAREAAALWQQTVVVKPTRSDEFWNPPTEEEQYEPQYVGVALRAVPDWVDDLIEAQIQAPPTILAASSDGKVVAAKSGFLWSSGTPAGSVVQLELTGVCQ